MIYSTVYLMRIAYGYAATHGGTTLTQHQVVDIPTFTKARVSVILALAQLIYLTYSGGLVKTSSGVAGVLGLIMAMLVTFAMVTLARIMTPTLVIPFISHFNSSIHASAHHQNSTTLLSSELYGRTILCVLLSSIHSFIPFPPIFFLSSSSDDCS